MEPLEGEGPAGGVWALDLRDTGERAQGAVKEGDACLETRKRLFFAGDDEVGCRKMEREGDILRKHRRTALLVLLLVLATIPLWPKRRDVPFRMVASFDSGSNFRGDDHMPPPYSTAWQCVTTHPSSELSAKVFAEWYPMVDFHFEEYNYISVHGYTLEKLWYWEIPWIKGDSAARHRGFVKLGSQGSPREMAVYEISKVCIQSPAVSRELSYYTRIVP